MRTQMRLIVLLFTAVCFLRVSAAYADSLPAPRLHTITAGNHQIVLKWSEVSKATAYKIYFGTSPSAYETPINVGNVKEYTLTGLQSGTTYYLTVTALKNHKESSHSHQKSVATLGVSLLAPVLNTAIGANHQVTLNWNPVNGASRYRIYFHSSQSRFGRIVDVNNSTTHTVKWLRSGTIYYFKVSAMSAGAKSPQSNEKSALTLPRAPWIYSAVGDVNKVDLKWSPTASATSYKVYYGTSRFVYESSIDVGNTTSYSVAGLAGNTKYYFAVTAVNSTGEGRKSFPRKAMTLSGSLPAPTLNAATGGQKQVVLNWSAVAEAVTYKIYYGTASGMYGAPVNAGNVTQFTVTGLDDGTVYYFAVTAVNPTQESSKSNEQSAKTLAILPTASITINPTSIIQGQSAQLSWECTNSDTCEITPNIGAVASSGTMNISPTATTDYTITATGPGGSVTNTASITVAIAPTASITINPESISLGQPATLSWQCTNADTCTITPGIGAVGFIGTMSVSPSTSTTYTLTAANSTGTDIQSATLIVAQLKPTVTLSSNASTIPSGSSATLTWSSTNAASLYIDNGIGSVANSGTVSVSPTATTTYTITTTGPLGSANASVTVHVSGAPEIPPAGTFGEQYKLIIPPDATVEKYAAERFAVIRGEVKDKNNVPLAQVSVVVKGQPQYGTGQTDANGQFSLPVDRNGILTIIFSKPGYLTTHRNVQVASNDIAIADTIQMLAEDSKATEVDLNGDANNVIVHQSTPVSDVSGTRQANVVISGDNQAYAVDEHGQDMFELTKLNVRATEFTTPESMPAALPPTSAFTYCVELKADGVDRVRFKDPVVVYVDNFLGFDVGEIVPVGYYDRDRGVWVASDNGRVVKLLDLNVDGIVDALDASGDGAPDDLNNDGDYSDEVKGLSDSTKYPPNKTFWRVSLTHFTPWDYNWPLYVSSSAISPNATGPGNVDQRKDPCKDNNKQTDSYVNCRSRIYNEDIDIPGTGLTLHYASNRAADYKTIITVPASGATVPTSLKRIVVHLNIAGRTFEQTLSATANQTAEFSWDGRDYLGYRVNSTVAYITTDFVYTLVYSTFGGGVKPAVFGLPGVSESSVPARDEYIYSKSQSIVIHNQSQIREDLAAGWTLSNHHYMSANDATTIYKGNGEVISSNNARQITTIAGTDVSQEYGYSGYLGDGGPATKADLYLPSGIAIDQVGNIYINGPHDRIRKIDVNGIIVTIAGGNVWGFGGDGGPATEAALYLPQDVAVDQIGNIYIADTYNCRIRKIDTNGIITTIAGIGTSCGKGIYSGDGGPATAARLRYPKNLTLDQNGNIYIADTGFNCIHKIDANGIITTIAGKGVGFGGYLGDGGPATAASLHGPTGITIDQSGNIYIADTGNNCIRKIDASGIITTVAGMTLNGFNVPSPGYSGDGGPATTAMLYAPNDVTVDQNGNIYIADTWNNRIRKIDVNGIITTVAGTGVSGYNGDNIPPTLAMLNQPMSVTVDHNGDIYISDYRNHRIRKVMAATDFISAHIGDMTFVEEGLGYLFSLEGKHKQTFDLDTQKVLEQFTYDSAGRLISTTDLFNNKITIERNSSGVPTAIVSPDGIRTNLTINANNHLTRITYPDGTHYDFQYSSGGLLTKETEPKGNFFTHIFDANGRITDVQDQEGGHEHFTRQVAPNSGDITTTITSGEGDVVTYLDKTAAGGEVTSTSSVSGVTKPMTHTRSADDLTSKVTLPDLTVHDLQYTLDPEYKFKYLKSSTVTMPSGLKSEVTYTRTYTDTNADDKKDLITHTASLNNKTATLTHNVLTSTLTAASPLGRTMTAQYDPNTLLTSKVSVPGLLDTTFTYDFKGRLTTASAGSRTMSLVYDLSGNVQSVTDPRGYSTSYTYDAVGRTKSILRPDATKIQFDYDANGNMTVLKNPSNQNHGYIYNNVNLATSYNPPISASTQYVYDKERRLKEINFPSGKKIKNLYTGILLTQVQTPEGNVDYSYLPSGQLSSVTKNGESLATTYDGSLLKTITSTGTLAQSLSLTYDNDFKSTSFTYAGLTNNFGYDDDGLLISSGRFTIARDVQNGLPTAVTSGLLNLSRTFNGYGEISAQTQKVNSTPAGTWALTYNNNGQIISKNETVAGITANYAYTYDSMDRLTKVEKDGNLVEEYRYTGADPLGTRTYEMNTLRGIAGRSLTYNAEDQLLNVGTAAYQYNADGFLSKKTDGANVTTYDYSSRGELLNVVLPNAQNIAYVYDPLGRRIAKKINGTIVEKYLWAGLTRLLAVYDAADTLVMRFEYSDGRMPNVMTKGSTAYYLTYDQVGSLRAVYDATGAIVKRMDYDSFGNIIADTNPTFTVPFGFAGGLDDRDIGLVHFGFRDYDPATGRWTAKDPIGFAGGDVDLYGYVLNDPVNLIDPNGLCWDDYWDYFWQGVYGDLNDLFSPFGDPRYYYEVGAVMETKFTVNLQDWIGSAGYYASGIASIGYLPKGIGFSNSKFLEGGRVIQRWANQHGRGISAIKGGFSAGSKVLGIAGAALTGYSVGETIDSYYYGYVQYKTKYGQ